MTEEEARKLREENAALKTELAQKDDRIAEVESRLMAALLRIEELERRLGKDSHNSSKPPSSDGLRRKVREKRKKSEKRSGGQQGHLGHTLSQVAEPDRVMMHRPEKCENCHQDLQHIQGEVKERRQVHDVPELRLEVEEHQVVEICCPQCQARSRGSFPTTVRTAAQYGPRVQALAVYLSQFQLLPMARVCETLSDLCHCGLSEGTLLNWIDQATHILEPTQQRIKTLLLQSELLHADETGVRIKGILHWVHVAATGLLTFYGWHRKRGQEAMDALGIWPHFQGRAMHDRWASYDQYDCAHSLCGAHLLRDCLFVAEQEKQPWGQQMFEVLLLMLQTTDQWRAKGANCLPKTLRDELLAQYFDVLKVGFAAHTAPSPPVSPSKKRGRPKQSASKNLLDALLERAEDVLAFLDDLTLPFTNNLAERDLRMIKVQQKISGTFRSADGATAFCVIRSYLSTMRKQGRSMLAALAAVFHGAPLPLAWGSG
jgi:transposase